MSSTLRFYYPLPRFPSVSVTGPRCELMCAHCKAHYLGHMPDVSTPGKLKNFCVEHERGGGVGLLVSGGSTLDGRVPLKRFLPTLAWVKENTGLVLNLHTGMLDVSEAEEVASTGADIVSVDMVGSEETLRDVYGLKASVKEYGDTLTNLRDAGAPSVAPHICVGLHYGEVKGEHKALEQSLSIEPEVIVFLGLIPTVDTPMSVVEPPAIDEIVGLIEESKRLSPSTEVSLGCMRSRGYKKELEWKAIEAGADRVALASRSTESRALEEGYQIKRFDGCCATPRALEDRMVTL
jgi:uncharacterized radical SAM superfamily protein